jgi:hypothetical protein
MNLNITAGTFLAPKMLGRMAGIVALTAALAGCMDVTGEIEVKSETSGKATSIITMGAEFYPMIKQMQEAAKAGGDSASMSSEDNFCKEEGDVLTENADGSATCTSVKEGELSEIMTGSGPNSDAKVTVVSPGVVRVAFSTADMSTQLANGPGGGEGTTGSAEEEQTKAMLAAYFEGHNATLRIKGKKVIDTNMTLSDDGTTAEQVIPFTELLSGKTDLPAELYAVVDTN